MAIVLPSRAWKSYAETRSPAGGSLNSMPTRLLTSIETLTFLPKIFLVDMRSRERPPNGGKESTPAMLD